MRVPKVSKVHQGFAGTFTHMDENDEEKEKKESFMMCSKKNIRNSSGLNITNRQNDTEQEDTHQAYIQSSLNIWVLNINVISVMKIINTCCYKNNKIIR